MKQFADLIERKCQLAKEQLGAQGLLSVEATAFAMQESQISVLADYLEMLITWSSKVDLVALDSPDSLVDRHIVDSYAAYLLLLSRDLVLKRHLVDIGSGAGLPGLVFCVLGGFSMVSLCEPRSKRVTFLKEVRRRLNIKDLELVRKSGSELSAEDLNGVSVLSFRALVPDPKMLSYIRGMLVSGFSVVYLAGADVLDPSLSPWKENSLNYSLPTDSRGRFLHILKV